MRLVATTARGLEEIVAGELTALGLEPSGRETGGVPFEGGWPELLLAAWRLRAANRVLVEVASWPAATDDELYRGARALVDRLEPVRGEPTPYSGPAEMPWIELFSPERSFSIVATSSASAVRDTRWIALKTKDAIVDGQRGRYGARANVARDAPDTALRVRLHRDRATLLVDATGEPLDRRGYRKVSTAAPLRETLAAAAILASGWNGEGPVVDPMCGSGTFLAEGGAIALGFAPNRLRTRWGFERLPGFRAGIWNQVRTRPLPAPGPDVKLVGVDTAGEARIASRTNLEAAGLLDRATLLAGDAFEMFDPGDLAAPAESAEPPFRSKSPLPPGPGLVAVNPPHGERMNDSPEAWKRLGDLLKRSFSGYKAVVFAGGESRGKHLGLKPVRRIPCWNGPLEARILVFELW